MTPREASLNKNEGYIYNYFIKTKEKKPKFQVNNLVRVPGSKKTFSKGDTTDWSYKKQEIIESNSDTIQSYRFDKLPERYSEALLKTKQSHQ